MSYLDKPIPTLEGEVAERFLEMAKLVSSWSSCYQENRQVGAVIVGQDKKIKAIDLIKTYPQP